MNLMLSLKRVLDSAVYLSVAFGLVLLHQLYTLVPPWLFYSVLAGWVAYLLVALAIASGRELAYPATLFLSAVTLIVSLPQPEHYSLVEAGPSLASLTFLIGSMLQLFIIILSAIYLLKKRIPRSR